jgi:beta-galactosidase
MYNFMNTVRRMILFTGIGIVAVCWIACSAPETGEVRIIERFTSDWRFYLGDVEGGYESELDDSGWRLLDLPHDWSIEGEFSEEHPAGPGGGALPGGIGWYRKTFSLPEQAREGVVFIDFDGIYMNSEVWINGEYLGLRPFGYISFRYELTPYLKFGDEENIIAVRVDNSQQPNSRWYSGSGIYRNVWLVRTGNIHVDHWGTFVTTPDIASDSARVYIETVLMNNEGEDRDVQLETVVYDAQGRRVAVANDQKRITAGSTAMVRQELTVMDPHLWSVEDPYLYRSVSIVHADGNVYDTYETDFGIRYFHFDKNRGFYLNGEHVRIKGVCNHHDLGFLGAAVNTRALERQLEIMQRMGVNAIRTAHNPPAPELLQLTDRMGIIVMDEAFDVWARGKAEFDYHLYWDDWHRRDLEDMVRRDRNHPSVLMWSIGNELLEQFDREDVSGTVIARQLAEIVRALDDTRPITAGLNDPHPENPIIRAGVLDLIGYNYEHEHFAEFPDRFPGEIFIATETTSALATRGYYDMPSDTIRRWPYAWDEPFYDGNPDNTVSAYDHVSTPWGSTHMETWGIVKQYEFLSGMFIWTGFDYLGEPTPYGWPSRSSYFGIIDLAGFPKDAYYMYKSEWTDEPILHIFPHWNWNEGDTVDVWAYTNFEEVELYLNGESAGVKTKTGNDLHLMWRLVYEPGVLRAVARRPEARLIAAGSIRTGDEMVREVRTAGPPAKISLEADRSELSADGEDLSFITVRIEDENGVMVPNADNLVQFSISGAGAIAGVDNGLQTSHESFQAPYRKAFNGKCLVVVRSTDRAGRIILRAESVELEGVAIQIIAQ